MIVGTDGKPIDLKYCKLCGGGLIASPIVPEITDEEVLDEMHDNPAKCIRVLRMAISQLHGELNAFKNATRLRN